MSKMILSRWNPRAEDREGSKKKGVHESRLRPYIHVSPSEFAEYGQPRFGEAVRLFRESDVQFLDVSFHRILEGNPNAKAWEEIENPDVMGLAWDGDDPIMFARLMGFDDGAIQVRFKTNGRFMVKAFLGGENITGSDDATGTDHVVVSSSQVVQLRGFLAGRPDGGYQFQHDDSSASRPSPVATSLKVEVTPEKQRAIRPENKGSLRLVLLHAGRYGRYSNQRTDIRVEKHHDIWRVKHVAWRFGQTTRPSNLHLFIAVKGGLQELEDRRTIGEYIAKSGTTIEVYTNKYPPMMDVVSPKTQIALCPKDSLTQNQSIKWDKARMFRLNVDLPPFHRSTSQLQDEASTLEDELMKLKKKASKLKAPKLEDEFLKLEDKVLKLKNKVLKLNNTAMKLEDMVQKDTTLGDGEKSNVEGQNLKRKGSTRSSTKLAPVPEEEELQQDLIDFGVPVPPRETERQGHFHGSDILCFGEENSLKSTDADQVAHEQPQDLIDLDDRVEGSQPDHQSDLLDLEAA